MLHALLSMPGQASLSHSTTQQFIFFESSSASVRNFFFVSRYGTDTEGKKRRHDGDQCTVVNDHLVQSQWQYRTVLTMVSKMCTGTENVILSDHIISSAWSPSSSRTIKFSLLDTIQVRKNRFQYWFGTSIAQWNDQCNAMKWWLRMEHLECTLKIRARDISQENWLNFSYKVFYSTFNIHPKESVALLNESVSQK